jgi:hypothetical protein
MAGKFLRLRRGRVGTRAAAVLGLTTLLSLALVAPASAVVASCSWAAGTLTITLAAGNSVTVSVGTSNSILVDGDETDTAPCDTGSGVHTTVDTTMIAIDGSTGNETATSTWRRVRVTRS